MRTSMQCNAAGLVRWEEDGVHGRSLYPHRQASQQCDHERGEGNRAADVDPGLRLRGRG